MIFEKCYLNTMHTIVSIHIIGTIQTVNSQGYVYTMDDVLSEVGDFQKALNEEKASILQDLGIDFGKAVVGWNHRESTIILQLNSFQMPHANQVDAHNFIKKLKERGYERYEW